MLRANPDHGTLQSRRFGRVPPWIGQDGMPTVPSPQVHQSGRSCGGSGVRYQRNGGRVRHGGRLAPI
eukprot:1818944-Heterocapsa_arctica.AAC.1